MRVSTEKQRVSFAAILLTLCTFALSPSDAFCRTQAGNRTRSSRTVRLDDHDHDHSPDLRAYDHSSADYGDLLVHATAPLSAAPLPFAGMVEPLAATGPSLLRRGGVRGRSPPVVQFLFVPIQTL